VNHEDTVRARYPNATARQFRVLFQRGPTRSPSGEWTIYRTESLGVNTLGTGATEEEAWATAAAGVIAAGPRKS
jgi:hypothetical protein